MDLCILERKAQVLFGTKNQTVRVQSLFCNGEGKEKPTNGLMTKLGSFAQICIQTIFILE